MNSIPRDTVNSNPITATKILFTLNLKKTVISAVAKNSVEIKLLLLMIAIYITIYLTLKNCSYCNKLITLFLCDKKLMIIFHSVAEHALFFYCIYICSGFIYN